MSCKWTVVLLGLQVALTTSTVSILFFQGFSLKGVGFQVNFDDLSSREFKEWEEKTVKNATPGHMELDPRYGGIFNTKFFQNYDSRIAGGGWESEPHSRPYQVIFVQR